MIRNTPLPKRVDLNTSLACLSLITAGILCDILSISFCNVTRIISAQHCIHQDPVLGGHSSAFRGPAEKRKLLHSSPKNSRQNLGSIPIAGEIPGMYRAETSQHGNTFTISSVFLTFISQHFHWTLINCAVLLAYAMFSMHTTQNRVVFPANDCTADCERTIPQSENGPSY